jgi:hypothetical protein
LALEAKKAAEYKIKTTYSFNIGQATYKSCNYGDTVSVVLKPKKKWFGLGGIGYDVIFNEFKS